MISTCKPKYITVPVTTTFPPESLEVEVNFSLHYITVQDTFHGV